MSRSVQTVGTFIGPVLAGFLYDLTRSYTIAFAIFASASLAATLLMFFARQPGSAARPGAAAMACHGELDTPKQSRDR